MNWPWNKPGHGLNSAGKKRQLGVTSCCGLLATALAMLGLGQLGLGQSQLAPTTGLHQNPQGTAGNVQHNEQLTADFFRQPSANTLLGTISTEGRAEGSAKSWSAELEKAIDRGISFLLQHQNKNGSWGSARRTKGLNIYAPVPGAHDAFRAAVTSLCISALLESGRTSGEVQAAVDRAEQWLVQELPHLRRATPDALYNVWGHAYAIQALVRLLDRPNLSPERCTAIRELITAQIEFLRRYQTVDGGWAYYDFKIGTQRPAGESNSFVTATVLVAFYEAQNHGFSIPNEMIERAMASIRRQQKPDFTYLYSGNFVFYLMASVNRPAGSLGRSQACNVALRLWGDSSITDQVLVNWLSRLVERNGWLDMGRKRPIPHESWFAVAGYFFYYGHYYAGWCLQQLPPEKRQPFQRQIAQILVDLQETDGSWWDFPFYDYHQPYGTAFAIMTLVRCRPQVEPLRLAQEAQLKSPRQP